MFEPKKDSPRWLLRIYPYLFFLLHDFKMFFKLVAGRVQFGWHYSWELNQAENNRTDEIDSGYKPGAFIGYKPESHMDEGSYRVKKSRHGIRAIVMSETDKQQDR